MESVMRRILQLSLLGLAAGAMNACKPEEVISTTTPPTAGVRFIHAVPDTGIMDFRAVDGVDFVEHHGVAFRSASGAFYKNAIAGSRHIRIFMSVPVFSTLPAEQQQAIASTVMADTTLTLEADHRYTFLLWGFARTGSSPSMDLTVLDDNPGDPGNPGGLRVGEAGAGVGGRGGGGGGAGGGGAGRGGGGGPPGARRGPPPPAGGERRGAHRVVLRDRPHR